MVKKFDERDTMFARMGYEKDSKEYKDYYSMRPEKKEDDDLLRELPHICGEGTATYDELNSKIAVSNFKFLEDIKRLSIKEGSSEKVDVDVEEITNKIKIMAKYFGACEVGIAKMESYHYYSHKGRDKETYGMEVDDSYKYGIVFAVEMNEDMINRAPQVEEVIETSTAYVKAGLVGMLLTYYINELGYRARNNMDGYYTVIAPLVAEDAGIGEIGRMGLLTTKKFGPRVRLGVVTTDLPLISDEKKPFGFKEFCKICNRCSKTCPGRAIPDGEIEECEGVRRWIVNDYNCYKLWRSVGTDCGVCISTCPFSHKIDINKIEKMKDNEDVMNEILEEHTQKYGIRPYNRESLNIAKRKFQKSVDKNKK